VAALAPATVEAELDDLLHLVAEGQGVAVGQMLRRLEAQGVTPVGLCIQAMRHFRALHVAASDPGGAASGLARARVFGPRRDRMQRQVGAWGARGLESALRLLVETDLTLRSSSRAPAMAVMERALIRLAMMRAQR
jgi:DNA polymerase-3 subunit delta